MPAATARQTRLTLSDEDHMRYWLMKSEPGECSIDDVLASPERTTPWEGVRNYQARNFMRDQMQVGDGVLFYHSNCTPPGIVGLARVSKRAYPDASQFDPQSHYFDPKATPEKPRWFNVDVQALQKTRLVSISELRQQPPLAHMRVLQTGSRLSITPVDPAEWHYICTQLLHLPA